MIRGNRTAIGRLLAVSLALASASVLAKTGDFTVKDVLSTPFPSDLVASEKGGLVAWVFDEEGAKNVWIADASGKQQGRRVTSYKGDDGYDLGQVEFDHTGHTLFYTRGGSLEGGGPVNATNLPSGPPRQEIWAISVDGGEPKRIAEGSSPMPSPTSETLAYIEANQIWIASLSGDQKPSQLIKDRGRTRSVVWSHDGSKLAFSSVRGDHAFIGIHDFAKKTITWLQPSVDSDMNPAWSPDDKEVAFIRIASAVPHPFLPHPEGQPWSIWIADATTGKGHQVWIADHGAGSLFHGFLRGSDLLWASRDRLVFPWEKTGWNRLYSVPVSSGKATLLAPGDSETFNAVLTPERDKVVFSQNLSSDTDRVHLWEVSVSGGSLKQLTKGTGIEEYPVVTERDVVSLHSDGRTPMRPGTIGRNGAITDLANAIPANFPTPDKLVEPQGIVFTSPDGVQVHGQLFVPKGRTARGPAILFFHGGPIREMFLGWHPMDAYHNFYGMNQYLANEGYVVLSVNYRGGIGYGMHFREFPGFSVGGGNEVQDILGAIAFLRARSDVDPGKIGIYGLSYGGVMTALGLARASDQLAVGVDMAGVHDWLKEVPSLTAPGADPAAAKLAWDSGALATVDRWTSPVLIEHGDDDRNVPFAESVELVRALREQGKAYFEQLIFPNEIHGLILHRDWVTMFDAADEFLGRYLKGKQ